MVELSLEVGRVGQSLFEPRMAVLDMCSAEMRLPMTPLEQEKLAVLQQTLKDYGLPA